MSPSLFGSILAVHTLASAFWFGVLLFNAAFLIPSIRATGAAGGQVMKHIVQTRRLPVYLNAAVLITIITGAALYWWASGGLAPAWLTSRLGLAISCGAILALLVAAMGQFINAPTAARLGQIGAAIQAAGAPPTPDQAAEVQSLQQRLAGATQSEAAMLAIALVAMVAGRYL